MYCAQCGSSVIPGQVYCSKCGQPIALAVGSPSRAQAAASAPSTLYPSGSSSASLSGTCQVASHLNILGILWIVYSALRLVSGAALMAFGHLRFPFLFAPLPMSMSSFLGPFLGGLGVLISALAIAGGIAGWGLMTHQPWARMLAIVVGCIYLIHIPFGTALGIYTLWVLLPANAAQEYQRLAAR